MIRFHFAQFKGVYDDDGELSIPGLPDLEEQLDGMIDLELSLQRDYIPYRDPWARMVLERFGAVIDSMKVPRPEKGVIY